MLIHEPDEKISLEREANRLQQKIEHGFIAMQEKTGQLLSELVQAGPDDWMRSHVHPLEKDRLARGVIFLGYRNDSLIVWTGSPPLRPSSLIGDDGPIVQIAGSVHLHAMARQGEYELHALRPVWMMPPLENRYIRSGFHPSWEVADGAAVILSGQYGPAVTIGEGLAFRLAWRDGALETGNWIWLRALLFTIAGTFIIAALWSLSLKLALSIPAGALIFFIALLSGLRLWWLSLPPVAPFDRLALFDPALYATSFLFPSLGDLLINSILLLVAAAFIRDLVQRTTLFKPHPVVAIASWSAILFYGKWVAGSMIGVVQNGSVDLDLYHIQGLSFSSGIALLSMAFLIASWCLFAIGCIGGMLAGQKPHATVWIGVAVVAVFILADRAFAGTDLLVLLWQIPLLLLMAMGKEPRWRFAAIVLGVVVISGTTAIILTNYTAQKERQERQVLAERLATREDPVVELLFLEMAPRLRSDRMVYEMLATGRSCSTSELDQLVRQRFFGGYWERYDIRLFAFGTRGTVLCATDPEPPRSFRVERSVFTDPRAAADMPDLLMEELPGQGTFYHSRVSVMPVDTLPPAQLIVELYPRTLSQGLGFPDLLIAGDDPVPRRAARYTHARYERGHLAEQAGPYAYPLMWPRRLDEEGKLWFTENGYEHFATSTPQGTILVLGSRQPSLLDKATTFSYLFTFFSLLIALAVGIRALVKNRGLPPMGIGVKVRIVLVIFSITSLVFFGFGTRRLLDAQYEQRAGTMILDKARSVHMELQHRLDGQPELTRDDAPYLDHILGQASNVFFTDITLYAMNGRMLATSRPQIFTSGLLGRRMDPVAYTELVLNGRSSFVHEGSIGSAQFRTAYMPLRDRDGNVLAYLSLPAFADQRQQEEERSSVLIAVVNLFVLLFALSVLVAVFISNWTLRPLDLLKRALSVVELRGGNRPIKYRGNDEVGQLVLVYNEKVKELQRSAEKLATSERESAWREMARQVAHEIKNPLTPMKLGIQQFQRSWDPAAAGAKEKLDRFSRSMVEQIDALNGVATAFSQFAQMPVADPKEIELNEVARSSVEVFRSMPEVKVDLIEEGSFIVRSDREHLVRTFNNLLKNAVQSIPAERTGHIQVILRRNAGEALVEVKDNGSGIPDDVRDRIFTPSFTTKSSGMGLGLAMVKRMIEGAGGKVWFESETDRGTSFFFTLPLVK